MKSLFQDDRPAPERRWIYWAELAMLTVGFLLVGWFGWSIAGQHVEQSYESYKLEAQVAGKQPTLFGYVRSLLPGRAVEEEEAPAPPGPPAERPRRQKRPPMERGAVVGRIEVPRINVSAVVREGSDDKTLKKAAGHVPYTALPGEHGNVGIAAHRDSFFRNLRGVRQGDRIRVTTTWGTYEYEVDSLKIVKPENVEVLDPTPEPALTLVTCYPFNYVGSAPKRFIVRARQIEPAVESSLPVKKDGAEAAGKQTSRRRSAS